MLQNLLKIYTGRFNRREKLIPCCRFLKTLYRVIQLVRKYSAFILQYRINKSTPPDHFISELKQVQYFRVYGCMTHFNICSNLSLGFTNRVSLMF
jgi:hypothetical protein